MNIQLRRRFWVIIHDVLAHPICGVLNALSPSTKPKGISHWLHEATMPPLPRCDEAWLEEEAREG